MVCQSVCSISAMVHQSAFYVSVCSVLYKALDWSQNFGRMDLHILWDIYVHDFWVGLRIFYIYYFPGFLIPVYLFSSQSSHQKTLVDYMVTLRCMECVHAHTHPPYISHTHTHTHTAITPTPTQPSLSHTHTHIPHTYHTHRAITHTHTHSPHTHIPHRKPHYSCTLHI